MKWIESVRDGIRFRRSVLVRLHLFAGLILGELKEFEKGLGPPHPKTRKEYLVNLRDIGSCHNRFKEYICCQTITTPMLSRHGM